MKKTKKILNIFCFSVGFTGFMMVYGAVGSMDINKEGFWTLPIILIGFIMMVSSAAFANQKT